jgi:hypothetical protein
MSSPIDPVHQTGGEEVQEGVRAEDLLGMDHPLSTALHLVEDLEAEAPDVEVAEEVVVRREEVFLEQITDWVSTKTRRVEDEMQQRRLAG